MQYAYPRLFFLLWTGRAYDFGAPKRENCPTGTRLAHFSLSNLMIERKNYSYNNITLTHLEVMKSTIPYNLLLKNE